MKSSFLVSFIILLSVNLSAEVVYLGSDAESVEVLAKQPTIFRFPSPLRTVSHVGKFKVKPANSSDPDYAVLSVTPRVNRGETTAVFVLADHSIYQIHLKIVKNKSSNTNNFYDFKDVSELASTNIEESEHKASSIELMKALMSKSWLSGYYRRRVSTGYVDYGSLEIKLLEVIEGPTYSGLTYRVRNKSKRQIILSQKNVRLGYPYKPLLSHISRKTLHTKGKRKSTALVRVVAIRRGKRKPEKIPFGFSQIKRARR